MAHTGRELLFRVIEVLYIINNLVIGKNWRLD